LTASLTTTEPGTASDGYTCVSHLCTRLTT